MCFDVDMNGFLMEIFCLLSLVSVAWSLKNGSKYTKKILFVLWYYLEMSFYAWVAQRRRHSCEITTKLLKLHYEVKIFIKLYVFIILDSCTLQKRYVVLAQL